MWHSIGMQRIPGRIFLYKPRDKCRMRSWAVEDFLLALHLKWVVSGKVVKRRGRNLFYIGRVFEVFAAVMFLIRGLLGSNVVLW